MQSLVRCNRLQFSIMYADILRKQCDEKLEKYDGSISQDISYYLYHDPRKYIKTGKNNQKNRKNCFYCWPTCQVSKKHIGFAFWLFFSSCYTKIESYGLICGVRSKGVISKTNP